MADNSFDQAARPAQQQPAPVQETVHTTVTVSTDHTIQAQSVQQLQQADQAVRRNDQGLGFGF